jgi:hypothetical protein
MKNENIDFILNMVGKEFNETDFNNLNLIDKLLYYEMHISFIMFSSCGLNFNKNSCLEELLYYNKDLYTFIEKNIEFFTSLVKDIDKIISDKSFKTRFKLGFGKLDIIIYTCIIIKSLHIIDSLWLLDYTNNSMLHRNVVYRNINKYVKVFSFLDKKLPIKENVFKIMILLNEYVDTKKITIRKKQHKKLKIKTEFYLKLNIIDRSSYSNRLIINFSKIEFQLLGEFHFGASYLNIFENIKKSNWQLIKNDFDLKIIKKLIKTPIRIDLTNWNFIKKNLILDYIIKYNINEEMFSNNINVSNLIDELILQKCIIIEKELEILKKIKLEKSIQKIENIEEVDDTIQSNQDEEEDCIIEKDKDLLNFKISENENIKIINSDIQKLYYFLIVEKISNIDHIVYLPHFLDFRGRFYPNSPMGFTNLKFIRALFQLKGKFNELSIKNSRYFSKIINEDIKFHEIFIRHIENKIDKYFLTVLLLELGKLEKSKITNAVGNTLNEFVELGTEIYLNFSEVKAEDLAYFLNIKGVIDNFLKNKVWDDVLIIRDSTGSSFQHWGVILGIQNDALDKLNLNGCKWFDIYTLIIDMFNKKNKDKYLNNSMIKNYLNRKYLKKIIMTVNYNAGEDLSLLSFINALKKNNKEIGDMDIYKEFINDFRSFINIDLFNLLYIKNKEDTLNNMNYKLKIDDKKISLIYLKSIEEKEVIKINNIRWIFVRKKLTNEISYHKTDKAFPANIIQGSDADLAHFLVIRLNCFSVHDSFAISLFHLHELMDLTNSYFSTKLNQDLYSIFVLI